MFGEIPLDIPETHPKHGSLNVPIEHHPTIRYMVYNGYYKVMSNIPKMGQLPTPAKFLHVFKTKTSTSACKNWLVPMAMLTRA